MLASPSYFFPRASLPSTTTTPTDQHHKQRNATNTSTMSQRNPLLRPPRPAETDRRSATAPPASPPVVTTPAIAKTNTPTRPVAVPVQPTSPQRTQAVHHSKTMPARRPPRMKSVGSNRSSVHDPDALPPAVAALLAMTSIPRPQPHQLRRRPQSQTLQRKMSAVDLINDWKADEAVGSLSSSPVLDVLLESVDDEGDGFGDDEILRSASAESVPSLEGDDKSLLSMSSLPTPDSLRSKRSYNTLRGSAKRAPSLPIAETCLFDHPLVDVSADDDDNDADPDDTFILTHAHLRTPVPKARSSLKSNLTASLQALRNVAISSIASLKSTNGPTTSPCASPQTRLAPNNKQPFSDDLLWSHPLLFPHMSSEIQPAGTTSRQSSNPKPGPFQPPPLNFEEQEAPYQLALHAPYLAEHRDDLPGIPMQTYNRCGGAGGKRKPPAATSEAGRAAASSPPLDGDGVTVRLREPRENSDFLRVIVLEMNMRRSGKLEGGRARIWLPPRASISSELGGRNCRRKGDAVPVRWVGMSARA